MSSTHAPDLSVRLRGEGSTEFPLAPKPSNSGWSLPALALLCLGEAKGTSSRVSLRSSPHSLRAGREPPAGYPRCSLLSARPLRPVYLEAGALVPGQSFCSWPAAFEPSPRQGQRNALPGAARGRARRWRCPRPATHQRPGPRARRPQHKHCPRSPPKGRVSSPPAPLCSHCLRLSGQDGESC